VELLLRGPGWHPPDQPELSSATRG
jgi:hypothetical protein